MIFLERLWQDLRYGVRMLAGSPGFTIVAVLSLAIGIGANCAIFSFADALVLRPLPVPRPGEVYTVGSTTAVEAFGASSIISSYPDYVDVRDRSHSFDGLAAITQVTAGFATDRAATPKLKMGMLASGNLFTVMRVEPTLGRAFRPEEDQVAGRDAVVVLGHALWEQEFASDPGVLGRKILLDGHEFTVIGVAPEEFTGLDLYVRSDFFVPIHMASWLLTDPKIGVAAGARRAQPDAERPPGARHVAGRSAGGVDDDRNGPCARVSGHEQEPSARRPHRAAGAHGGRSA